jgi:TolA-binding protein
MMIIKNPGTEESINALYQKGRIFFIKEDYEKSVEYMHSFLEKSGENKLNGNAYFWIAESLFFLGHKEESLVIYKKVIKEYPESYKFEASNYRVELIKLGKREEELMKLLKWSHEESLKERELFIKKEKEYKQAILSYQKKLAILSDNDINNEVLTLKETNSVLKKQIAAMQGEVEKHKKDIEILKKMEDDKKTKENKTGKTLENTISEPVNEKQ